MMHSPDEVVTRFCALWSKPDPDEIASCFTEDAVYRNIPPTPPIEGREAIRAFIAEFDTRRARVVEMRYFGGLTADEIAAVLHISTQSVNRDWSLAKAWLVREMSYEGEHGA